LKWTLDRSRDVLRDPQIASEGAAFGRNRRSSSESGLLEQQSDHEEVADAASESVSAALRAPAQGRDDDANGPPRRRRVPAPTTAVASETQMHFAKCGSRAAAVAFRRALAARGTGPMTGVASAAGASERMHLRLAGS
jgi:hypothetical protein